eukprot:g3459.t1
MSDHLNLFATINATGTSQNKWVTCIAADQTNSNQFVTGGRDNKVRYWSFDGSSYNESSMDGTDAAGYRCVMSLSGHSHNVSDIALSTDGQFALSSSWDNTIRLWDLNNRMCTRRFVSHTKDALSVAFSPQNRQIVSGSMDGTIKLWNTLGECKFTIRENGHKDWVTCVRFSPSEHQPAIVSCGYDKAVKVWDIGHCKLKTDLLGHQGVVNTVTVSPDGSLCASGGKDGTAMLWDLSEGRLLYELDASSEIHALVFSPNRYWLCAATNNCVKIWDLESKVVVAELTPEFPPVGPKALQHFCCSLEWSADGATLYSGYTDGNVRVWKL